MVNKYIFIPLLMIIASTVSAHDFANRVHAKIAGPIDELQLLPNEITLKKDQRYQLSIENATNTPVTLAIDHKFFEAIETHYIKQSSHINQQSISISPGQTVSWSLTPHKKGRYSVYEYKSALKTGNKIDSFIFIK